MQTRYYVVLAGAFFSALSAKALATPAADGWQKLAKNQNAAARASFLAALKQDPANTDAICGLAIVSRMEDASTSELRSWRSMYHAAPASRQALAWWPEAVEQARKTAAWDLLDEAARDILAAKGVSQELAASARLALADLLDRAGRHAEADAAWSRMGFDTEVAHLRPLRQRLAIRPGQGVRPGASR